MRNSALAVLMFASFGLQAQPHPVNSYPGIYSKRGIELFEEGRFNAAVAQFEIALRNDPTLQLNDEVKYFHALSKLYAKHDNAEPFLVSYLSQNPNESRANQANLALGDYFYELGQYASALGYYRDVQESTVAPDRKMSYFYRTGFCLVQKGKYEQGKDFLKKVVDKPGNFRGLAQYYYGYACLMEGDFEAAYNSFKVITDERFEKIHFYMAQVLYQLSRYDEAIKELAKVNTRKVKPAEKDDLLAKCYYRQKNYEKASEIFEKLNPRIDKLESQQQFEIGYAYAKSGRLNESLPWFREVAKNNDSLAQIASYELAKTLLTLNNYREASLAFSEVWRTGFNEEIAKVALYTQAKIAVQLREANSTKLLDRYVRLFPKSPEAREASKLKARLLLNTDKYREALQILEEIENLDDATLEIYQKVALARGMELYKNRNWQEALELFEKCSQKNANRKFAAQAAYWKAETLSQMEKSEESLVAYKSFLDKPKSNEVDEFAYAYYGQGYVFYKKKDYEMGATFFREFTQKVSGNKYDEAIVHDAYLRLGDCQLMVRNLEGAVRAYAYVSGKKGRDADYALYQSAIIYGLLERSEEKVTTLRRLLNEYPRSPYILDAYNDIASEYMMQKQYDQAEKYYSTILEKFPGTQLTRKAYSTLGRIYYNQKNIDKAIASFTQLYDEFKGTPDAQSAAELVKTIYTEEGRAKDYVKWASSRGGISSAAEDSVLYETAITAYDKGEFKKAIPSFESYLQEKPNGNFNIPALYYLGMSYENVKQPQKALEVYKKVSVANSGEYKEDATIAVLKIYGNDAACEDITAYLEILESITRSKDLQRKAWKSLMYCYSKSGNTTGLKNIASKAVNDNTVDQDLKYQSQLIIYRNGDRSSSTLTSRIAALEAIYKGKNNKYAAEAKYLEAEAYYEVDSLESAKESCYQLLDTYNAYDEWVAKGLLLLGDAFAKEGDLFNAKVTWNTILENFNLPKYTDPAKKKIAEAEAKGSK
jgi:tetratricopeptide (TPR) repeat protein